MSIIRTENLSKRYQIGDRHIEVLKNLSLSFEPGQFTAIIGTSGSGKSTLLSLLSGLDNPSAGRIWIKDQEITNLTEDELAPLRNETLGFVFQSFHLVPSLSAIENIMFPAELRGDKNAQQKAESLLERVNLSHRAENFPHQLSGGEKQRVAICRSLINDPEILFADEPTGNLDSANGQGILDLILDLQTERNTTLVLVTHDPNIAALAERVIRLQDGELVSDKFRMTSDESKATSHASNRPLAAEPTTP